jgi:hypothetical protein
MPMISLNFSTPKSLNNFYIYLVGGAIDILSMIIMVCKCKTEMALYTCQKMDIIVLERIRYSI